MGGGGTGVGGGAGFGLDLEQAPNMTSIQNKLATDRLE